MSPDSHSRPTGSMTSPATPIPQPPPASRRSPPGGTRRTSRSRPSAGRRAGRAGAGPAGPMDRRPPIRNDRRRILLGWKIDCVHASYPTPSPNPQLPPHCFSLSGCIRFATSEMHLGRNAGRFAPQVAIGLGFKIFQEKTKLRVRPPSRDGGGAIVAPWTGLEAGQNRPYWTRFGGVLQGFGPAFWGRRPTSGPTGSGVLSATSGRQPWEVGAR